MKKKVSIILPVYNCENTISETINSVLNQSYNNFELIVINDGSKDNTLKICQSFKNKSLKIIDKKNGGVSKARNAGLDTMTGEYCCFIDGDDLYDKDYLKNLVGEIEKEYDWVSCNYKKFELIDREVSINEKEYSNISEYIEEAQSSELFNQLWNKIYRTKIIQENNIRFDETISIAEDLKFNIEYIKVCKKIKHINEPLYKYRISANGLGFKYRKDANDIKMALFREEEKIFNSSENSSDYIYKLYIKEIFSSLSKIVDKRNIEGNKRSQIRSFLKSNYDIVSKTKINNFKYKMLLNIIKTNNISIIYIIAKIANLYDALNKKRKFGIGRK